MRKSVFAGAAVAAILASAVAGYRYGAGTWPALPHSGAVSQLGTAKSPAAKRTVLYWKDPAGKNDFSPEPRKTADGRDYLPVYEDEEASFKEAKPAKSQLRPEDPLLPQPHGTSGRIARAQKGFDGDGLRPRL